MEFEQRLEKAINRGEHRRDAKAREAAEQKLSEEDCRTMHSGYRLELSDHIETCLRKLADHFPGFRFSTVVGEEGWGARVSRDDVNLTRGKGNDNLYSRLELLIRPFSTSHIVELVAKGTIRNKEAINQSQYQFLADFDMDSFVTMIDQRVLDYAEQFAAGM